MVKNKITHVENLTQGYMGLIHIGKQLENDQSCSDYGIQDESYIHIKLRLPGGVRVFYLSR